VTFSWESIFPAVLLVGCLYSSWWGMRRFFTRPAGLNAWMKLIAASATIFGALHLFAILFSSSLTAARSLAGSFLYLLSGALFWWAIRTSSQRPLSAAFSPDLPVHLVQNGPYRFVRHPLYTSYLIMWVAGWIVTAEWWLIPTVLIMLIIYFSASSAEEDKFLRTPLSESYRQYRLHTGRFVPNPVKLLSRVAGQPRAQTSQTGP
jgi:protein-S-isoprenylcysteine O-methyltransferase Ste14